jgi:hypothetical protein
MFRARPHGSINSEYKVLLEARMARPIIVAKFAVSLKPNEE